MKCRYYVMEKVSKIKQSIRFVKLRILGYTNISRSAILERNLTLDRVYPKGIHIGDNTLIASNTTILSHEHIKRSKEDPRNPWVKDTYIGKNCFIGVGVIILPGIWIGDEVIIGAGAVVTKNIPSNSVAAGNPARIIRSGIRMNEKAIRIV